MQTAELAARYHALTQQAGDGKLPTRAILTLLKITTMAVDHFGELLQHAAALEDTVNRQRHKIDQLVKANADLAKSHDDLLVQNLERQGDLIPAAPQLPTYTVPNTPDDPHHQYSPD